MRSDTKKSLINAGFSAAGIASGIPVLGAAGPLVSSLVQDDLPENKFMTNYPEVSPFASYGGTTPRPTKYFTQEAPRYKSGEQLLSKGLNLYSTLAPVMGAMAGDMKQNFSLANPLAQTGMAIPANAPSHEQGGVPIEAEGGEIVLNEEQQAYIDQAENETEKARRYKEIVDMLKARGMPEQNQAQEGAYVPKGILQRGIPNRRWSSHLENNVVPEQEVGSVNETRPFVPRDYSRTPFLQPQYMGPQRASENLFETPFGTNPAITPAGPPIDPSLVNPVQTPIQQAPVTPQSATPSLIGTITPESPTVPAVGRPHGAPSYGGYDPASIAQTTQDAAVKRHAMQGEIGGMQRATSIPGVDTNPTILLRQPQKGPVKTNEGEIDEGGGGNNEYDISGYIERAIAGNERAAKLGNASDIAKAIIHATSLLQDMPLSKPFTAPDFQAPTYKSAADEMQAGVDRSTGQAISLFSSMSPPERIAGLSGTLETAMMANQQISQKDKEIENMNEEARAQTDNMNIQKNMSMDEKNAQWVMTQNQLEHARKQAAVAGLFQAIDQGITRQGQSTQDIASLEMLRDFFGSLPAEGRIDFVSKIFNRSR